MNDLMHLANNIAQTPCFMCVNAVERGGVEVCVAADSVETLTRIPKVMQDFLDGRCPCFERGDRVKETLRYTISGDPSLSGHPITIPDHQCTHCCKSEVHTVLRGVVFFRAIVCDYNYPDDPGILDCVIRGECPYFSPTSTKRVIP